MNKPDPSWRWCREDRTTGVTTRSNFSVASNIVETIYGDDDDAIRSHMLDAYLGQTIETPTAFYYYQPLWCWRTAPALELARAAVGR